MQSANYQAQKNRILKLKNEIEDFELDLSIAIEPNKKRIQGTKIALDAARKRLERLQENSTLIPEAKADLAAAQSVYDKAMGPLLKIQNAIDENKIAMDRISSDMVFSMNEGPPIFEEKTDDNDEEDSIFNHGSLSLLNLVLHDAILKAFQFFIEKKSGVDFVENEFEKDIHKREIREAWEWISQPDDDEFYAPSMQKHKHSKEDVYVGPFTFAYTCNCLDADSRRIREGLTMMEHENLQGVKEAMARYRSQKKYEESNKETA